MKAGVTQVIRDGQAALLCANGYEDASENWFSPGYWGDAASRVGAGGRGSAWFIQSGARELVLRHYLRGGLIARLSHRSYLFSGFGRTRSFAEFRLLSTLRHRKLPVPAPVAAYARRTGLFRYQAAILIEKIDGAIPMPEHPDLEHEVLWRRVGEVVARFHAEGLDHVDLNCDNILIASGEAYLIDMDRCRLRRDGKGPAGWRRDNLNRLRRSVEKRCKRLSESRRDVLWQALLAGYGENA